MNNKAEIIWMRIIGASFGAVGFILLGVGNTPFFNIFGGILIGIGTMLVAGGS